MGLEKEDRYFDLDRIWKGLVLVIINFFKGLYVWGGVDNDWKYMKELFEWLGFGVICYEDVIILELIMLLEECKFIINN